MRTATILGILLIGSITLNLFLWLDEDETPPSCFATVGFKRQATIDPAAAEGFVREYKSSLTDPDSIIGGIITRSAFDEMLCTADCNAISYMLASDSTGKTGPGGNGVFLIFSGLNVKYDETTDEILEYKDLGIKKYILNHWCPPTCNPY